MLDSKLGLSELLAPLGVGRDGSSSPKPAPTDIHLMRSREVEANLVRLTAELEQAFAASRLSELPQATPALNDLLVRLQSFDKR